MCGPVQRGFGEVVIPQEHEETKERLYFFKACIVPLWIGFSGNTLTSISVCFFGNHVKKFIQQEELQEIFFFAVLGNSAYSSRSCSERSHIYWS